MEGQKAKRGYRSSQVLRRALWVGDCMGHMPDVQLRKGEAKHLYTNPIKMLQEDVCDQTLPSLCAKYVSATQV